MRRALPVALLALSCALAACREEGTITVHTLTLNGVNSVDVGLLKNALATREDTKIPLIGKRLPWSKQRNYFDRGRFDADLKRIEAFYADRGYPNAKVTGFDVKVNAKQDAVDVTLTIAEGDPVLVSSVELRGFDIIPPDHLVELQEKMPVTAGMPRDRQIILTAHDMVVNELRDHGYPYARVSTDEIDSADGKSAAFVFTAEPGPLAHFGVIDIAGNRSVGANIIRRKLLFKPGDLYRRSVVQNSQRQLYGMELFQFVNIESVEPERQDPDVRTRITVAEGRHQRVNGGIGYGTEEKARVEGEYHHVNFLGGARSAGAHGRWSSLDRGIRLDVNQPYFFAPKLTLVAEGQRWNTFTPAYESLVMGAKMSVIHRINPQTWWTASLSSAFNKASIGEAYLNDPELRNDLIALGLDPTTGTQEGTLGAIGLEFVRSTTDSPLNAHEGYNLTFTMEEAGIGGTYDYDLLAADGRHFFPIGSKLVVANRLQAANIHAANDDATNVPFAKKYFLGGASSVRGWGRYEVSPLGGSGLPIGGNTMLAFSSELRLALAAKAGGVLFLDAGNVWPNLHSAVLGDIRYAVGTGIRYDTPVGPLRFDFGYQLNPIDGLLVNGAPQVRQWRVHFSIGQAF